MSKQNFTIGFDAEFVILDKNGEQVNAKDCASADNSFGYDGHSTTGEARVEPSQNPIQLVSNLQKVFLKKFNTDRRFFEFNLEAGSCKFNSPLGAHIHLGIKGLIDNQTITQVLDNYVGFASLLIENQKEGIARRKCAGNYGKM